MFIRKAAALSFQRPSVIFHGGLCLREMIVRKDNIIMECIYDYESHWESTFEDW